MKKYLLTLLTFGFINGLTPASAAPLTLVKEGKPNATIVVEANAPGPIQEAALDLQKYLKKISGVELPLNADGKDVPGITLNVGKTETAAIIDQPNLQENPEAYAIRQRGDNVYFSGNYPSPTAFAVYSFLQDQLGVRWFAPGDDWEYVPQHQDKSTFTVNVQNVVSVPDTSPRVWADHQWTKTWRLRNKVVQSEKVTRRNFQNFMFRIFPPSKYAKTNPEYYPLINGKRQIPSSDWDGTWWPCIGNPEVQRITAEYIHQWFKENPDQDSISLGMDDIMYMCEDPLCHAMDFTPDDYKKRNLSSRYYKFINIVAKQVKRTDPDKYIGVLIYHMVVDPPADVLKLEDNVFGYIANATGSPAQWFQPNEKQRWLENTKEWAKRVKHLSRYEYFGLSTFVPRIFPHTMAESMSIDHSLGFEGMFSEIYTFLPQTAPMIWALAQLQWDRELEIDDLLNEFYTKMYGPAAPTMEKYFDLMEDSWNTPRPERTGWVWRQVIQQAISISPEAVQKGTSLLDKAYQQANTPLEKKRVSVMQGGLQYASYPVIGYDLAKKISDAKIQNLAEAQKASSLIREFANLLQEREEQWPRAQQRDDLLGENLRNFLENDVSFQTNTAPLDTPAIAGITRLIDWYHINQPEQAPELTKKLLQNFPEGSIGDTISALTWVKDNNIASLLKNGDFESVSATTASAPVADWGTQGAPAGWHSWNTGKSEYDITSGRDSNRGVQIQNSTGEAVLLQNIPVQAGKKYLAVAWIKEPPSDKKKSALTIRMRNEKGWYTKAGGHIKLYPLNDGQWNQVLLLFTVPEDVTAITFMVGVNRDGVGTIFDDAGLYEIP